jgi:hypothetical protein
MHLSPTNFYCVKDDLCHREGLCIGERDDGFVCPFLRMYASMRRLEAVYHRLKEADA